MSDWYLRQVLSRQPHEMPLSAPVCVDEYARCMLCVDGLIARLGRFFFRRAGLLRSARWLVSTRRTSGPTRRQGLSMTWTVRISGHRLLLARPARGRCRRHTSRCWSTMGRGTCIYSEQHLPIQQQQGQSVLLMHAAICTWCLMM